MAEFQRFKIPVAEQFKRMCSTGKLYIVDIDKDLLWNTYLDAFPEGTNPIYRKRREYDCACCRQFIRTIGHVVAIDENMHLMSIWDIETDVPHFKAVADTLSKLVKSKEIVCTFMHFSKTVGTDKNHFEVLDENKNVVDVQTYQHFFLNLPKEYTVKETDIGTKTNEITSGFGVFRRALDTIDIPSLEMVLELIDQNILERGMEFRNLVSDFYNLKKQYIAFDEDIKLTWIWKNMFGVPEAVRHIRNRAIGTLLVDLSENVELSVAVRKFESVVAPENYKRSKTIVTKSMIAKAQAAVKELGYLSALERRPATIKDINVNNILYIDRSVPTKITGDVFDSLMDTTKEKKQNFTRVVDMPIEQFIMDVLPTTTKLEVMVDNKHKNNFMTLITSVDPTANIMFKWDNPFSWTYRGDFADAIRERVKAAGGVIDAELCFRLAWNNTSDLDIHVREPNGYDLHFGNRQHLSPSGGRLDVDANAHYTPLTNTPVENIYYKHIRNMQCGEYLVYVHNYINRSSVDVGFELDMDHNGTITKFVWDKDVATGDAIGVVKFKYDTNTGITILDSLAPNDRVENVWGVNTSKFTTVKTMMYSPNYWDGKGVGNKHFFFILDGCKCDEEVRGFYNEYLKEELMPHRKVFETLGQKLRVGVDDVDTLCGVGFSSTLRNEIIVRVTGATTRVICVKF